MPEVDVEGARILGRARRITLVVRAQIEEVFKRHGLDTGEFDVLATLRRNGPPFMLRPTELYRSMMVSSGGMTDRLNRLENAGLIRRVPSEEDRRSLWVALTEEGRAVIESAFREDMKVERSLVDGLSAKERKELIRLLQKLAVHLGA